jgi:ribonuclease HI
MEAMAVLETLKWFKEPIEITIISDSQYVVNTINEDWVGKWYREKDYSKKNLDIWFEILDYLNYHKVTMEWTKGHADNTINNEVDELCVFAARCLNLPEDEFSNKSKKSC